MGNNDKKSIREIIMDSELGAFPIYFKDNNSDATKARIADDVELAYELMIAITTYNHGVKEGLIQSGCHFDEIVDIVDIIETKCNQIVAYIDGNTTIINETDVMQACIALENPCMKIRNVLTDVYGSVWGKDDPVGKFGAYMIAHVIEEHIALNTHIGYLGEMLFDDAMKTVNAFRVKGDYSNG